MRETLNGSPRTLSQLKPPKSKLKPPIQMTVKLRARLESPHENQPACRAFDFGWTARHLTSGSVGPGCGGGGTDAAPNLRGPCRQSKFRWSDAARKRSRYST